MMTSLSYLCPQVFDGRPVVNACLKVCWMDSVRWLVWFQLDGPVRWLVWFQLVWFQLDGPVRWLVWFQLDGSS